MPQREADCCLSIGVPYQPIEITDSWGTMRTAALVGLNGSVDWYCVPSFDSPSVFGALLDAQHGGHFSIAPRGADYTCKQLYAGDERYSSRASSLATASARSKPSFRLERRVTHWRDTS